MDDLIFADTELNSTEIQSIYNSVSPYSANTNTKLLLDFDGDESYSNHSIAFNGNAQMVNDGEFDGAYSFDGVGDALELADSPDWDVMS